MRTERLYLCVDGQHFSSALLLLCPSIRLVRRYEQATVRKGKLRDVRRSVDESARYLSDTTIAYLQRHSLNGD